MDDRETIAIPYFVHEGEMSRLERLNKRLWILLVILVILLVGSNAGWMIYESQFVTETVTESYEAKADGNSSAVLNGDGEVRITYGGNGEIYPDGNTESPQDID